MSRSVFTDREMGNLLFAFWLMLYIAAQVVKHVSSEFAPLRFYSER